jgi:Flp pilus assembly pilin Flp
MSRIAYLLKCSHGATMVEYGLLIGLIAALCVVALQVIGPLVAAMFEAAANAF